MDEMEEASTSRSHRYRMSDMMWKIFNELRMERQLCDVVIRVDGVEFHAHKNILCSCSSYFRALFTSVWSDSEKQAYDIPGVSPDMMHLIMEYAYTRSVPVTEDNVQQLLPAADQFNILGLVRACCEFLESQLCVENCIGVCRFADLYACPDLKLQAYRYILRHFEEMVRASESEEFLELSLAQLCDIIEKDALNVKQEEVVFEAILRWIGHNAQERKAFISVLLPKVRMALMPAEYIITNVRNNALVMDSPDCRPIIINAIKAMCDLNRNGPSDSDFQNPLTRPRLPSAILLAIDGWSLGFPTNGIEAYDPRAERWVNVTNEDESPRAYRGAVYLDGFVYCVGGFDGSVFYNSVHKFNPVTRTWHQAAPMHERRCYVSVAVLDGCIYAMGGMNGHTRLNTAERYEPETNQWTLIPPMNEQRSDASATTLHGKVYICGGFSGTECLITAECYSPETNQWTVINPMSSRRTGVAVIAYGEQVYAVGGFDGDVRLRTAEAYNPRTNAWRTVSCMFNPRSNFGIEVVDDLLFVVGGYNGLTTTFDVECYDEKTDEWYNAKDMYITRSALSCCVVNGLPNVEEYIVPRHPLPQSQEEPKLSTSTDSILSM